MGRTTVTADVVTETPQTSPPAPSAWLESGYVSALLQACWDVRDVRPLSSVCATLRYGGILPCSCHLLKPLSSGSLPPLATASPSVSTSTGEDAAARTRFMQRRHLPASLARAQAAQEHGHCSADGQLGACCPVGGITVWHRVGSSWGVPWSGRTHRAVGES